jgi:protein transport protein SEC61 subunit gamma and related proteins
MSGRLRSFLAECARVLRITRKPTKQEYKDLVKITGIGILVIGFMGFVIQIAYVLIFR